MQGRSVRVRGQTIEDVGWSVVHDEARGLFRLRLPESIPPALMREAVGTLAEALLRAPEPSIVVADLLAVHRLDPLATLVGIRAVWPAVGKIKHVHLLVHEPGVRAASVAAARSLGLAVTVHEIEPPELRLISPRLCPAEPSGVGDATDVPAEAKGNG